MKKHTKIYMDYFGYDVSDFIPCEVCGKKAVDIHHVISKGMGGSKSNDRIDNLIALCRDCHDDAHGEDNIEVKIELQQIISKRDGPKTKGL